MTLNIIWENAIVEIQILFTQLVNVPGRNCKNHNIVSKLTGKPAKWLDRLG